MSDTIHIQWFNTFRRAMYIAGTVENLKEAKQQITELCYDCLPGLEESDRQMVMGWVPETGTDWAELTRNFYNLCGFCMVPGWDSKLDIPEEYKA
ncbi:MAG: hypothetical protein E6Q97_07620 [Desulfurellales bacterium]|nr:MAG: hypothetical protein E6Q97_07620 [Desulfurellales bacterium]